MTNFWALLRSKWVLGALAVIILGAGGWYLANRGGSSYQFIPVEKGTIIETVSVTGNTTPLKSVSLGFQSSGTIASVNYQLGDTVQAGAVIAQLNTASLSAALAQAEASVAAQQATLEGLQAGPQPQDVAASQAALMLAQQNLANQYASIVDAQTSAYTSANDAVRSQIGTLFSNAETSQPQLTFSTSDSQAAVNAINLRAAATTHLNEWQTELAGISASSPNATLSASLTSDLAHLSAIQNLLVVVSTTLSANVSLSPSQLAADQASLKTAITEVNTAVSNLNTITQDIATQQATVAQAQAQLAVAQAGSTPQVIAAQEAQVQVAQAEVASAQANLRNVEIVAPISGTLTQLDAKSGQQATQGSVLVSIIGNGGFEVDAGVSETDVGKLAIGDTATMTLDAFPGQTFAGHVFYVAPAQSNNNGVITYLTKLSFDQPNPELKSGLTANVDIDTKEDQGVLILPQYAILQNDQGTFVEVLQKGAVVQVPVTLGIADENGNVEILSGVTEGEEVINIGLKAQ